MMTTMWILGGVFATVGLPMVAIAHRAYKKDRLVGTWPRADGVVTSATIATHSHRVKERTGLTFSRTMYTPTVSYTYSVGGQTFESSRSVESMSTSQAEAQTSLDKYPPQKQIVVMYDPMDPKVTHLELPRSTGVWILGGFGVFWISLGVLLFGLSFL